MDKRLVNQDKAKKKYIKELNLESIKKIGYSVYCIKCGSFCPGGLIENKYCNDCLPHCSFCEEHGNNESRGSHVIGQIWNEYYQKKIVFNGYLCEQHTEALENWHYVD